jgi:hypothetical protein
VLQGHLGILHGSLHALEVRLQLSQLSLLTIVAGVSHRNLFDYDQVVNTQRDRVYAERRRALLSDKLAPAMIEYAERTCDDILEVRGSVCLVQHLAAKQPLLSVLCSR